MALHQLKHFWEQSAGKACKLHRMQMLRMLNNNVRTFEGNHHGTVALTSWQPAYFYKNVF